jgi:hypothetical protein
VRDLYAQLPDSPLPAVITCIATTATARREGHALRLVAVTCDDLAGPRLHRSRGVIRRSGAARCDERRDTCVLERAGFVMAAADERFPVMRRELV